MHGPKPHPLKATARIKPPSCATANIGSAGHTSYVNFSTSIGKVRRVLDLLLKGLSSKDRDIICHSMGTSLQFHEQAEFLRESSGSNIERTLHKAVKVLALFQIPHYVCGGFAVQEHGYPRFTVDVDIIVPDVEFAREKLCLNGFKENPGSKMTVTDRETKVEVDLLPAGSKLDPGPVTFPVPTNVSDKPQMLTLESLISSKLSTYIGRGIQRAQDYADVVKLVQANRLPRGFGVDPRVRDAYAKIWDELHRKE